MGRIEPGVDHLGREQATLVVKSNIVLMLLSDIRVFGGKVLLLALLEVKQVVTNRSAMAANFLSIYPTDN